jgi:hypothetical protein
MKKMLLLFFALFALKASFCQNLKVFSNFESGSARVLELNQQTQTLRIAPAGDTQRGMPNWWYLRVEGIDINKPLILEVAAREDLIPEELTGQGKKIAPGWTWPAQAAISMDGKIWKQTATGQIQRNVMVYHIMPTSSTLWLAWGPPFTPTDASNFVNKIAKAHLYAKTFTLCTSLEGREVPALHIADGSIPIIQRPAIWINARQHAWECGGSWVGAGLIEWLVSDNQQAKWLREHADIYFIPVMDVDHVATGDGGKLAQPQDHNLDWSNKPHWPEIAAAQKHILALTKEGRMNLFLDLHNPAASNKLQTAYVIEKAYMPEKAEPRKLRFVELMIAEFGTIKQNPAAPPKENPDLFHRVSVPWVLEHGNPNTIAFCIETPWNTPLGIIEGYSAVGQKLGKVVERLLREEIAP